MFNIQPFGNVLVRLEIKGRDLYDIIDAQISPSYGPDYSISGFAYTWDPKTNKTAAIFLEDGTPIDLDQTYTLTVNNFMASASGSKYLPISRLGKIRSQVRKISKPQSNLSKALKNRSLILPKGESKISRR